MCGITGFFSKSGKSSPEGRRAAVAAMNITLKHRGPDDEGAWVSDDGLVALGHRRLSILDLTMDGHQPMWSHSGRYVMVFNGEIYNFAELKRQLEEKGHIFKSRSDTEVMLQAFEAWGVEEGTRKFVGMFAFAVWDRAERSLYLGRDRIGEKPLYYGWSGDTFLFASELKAMRAHPDWRAEIDRDALALYVRYNYVPAPYSIYKGFYKVPPGGILRLEGNTGETSTSLYWEAKNCVDGGMENPYPGTPDDAASDLEKLLLDVISHQMVADVPVGAFLSGGVDSSTIVALMQAVSSLPVRTFTIGFDEEAYNEARFAKKVAEHLGTDHTELYVRPEETLEVIPRLPTLYDEPFADSSQIPTFLVSELARRHVTVSLSGDAGDELFGGYNRYIMGPRLRRRMRLVPRFIGQGVARSIRAFPPHVWARWFAAASPLLPNRLRVSFPGDKLYKVADMLGNTDPQKIFLRLIACGPPGSLVIGGAEPVTFVSDRKLWNDLPDFTRAMMYMDLVSYLPDDILVKVDRAAMGVSLESRIPFLDHRVVEFAWRLPESMKIEGLQGKQVIRKILYKYVPRELIERPKTGFGIPVDYWLRGPLRDWAEALLDEGRLKKEGYFDPAPIRQKWADHLSGRDYRGFLWGILMFQAWQEAN